MKSKGSSSAIVGEWDALAVLRAHLDGSVPPGVEMAIGDDCAVLSASSRRRVWTTDACMENVHFKFDWLSPADVAWKALHAAVSDVAAMGAKPVGALCHVTMNPTTTRTRLEQFARGQAAAARACGCPIVGGNLTSGREFQVVTSVLGEMTGNRSPMLRSGARPGDEIWLCGQVGWAGLGFQLLQRTQRATGLGPDRCVRAFRRPRALVEEGLALVGRANCCLDVSDGLAGDALHLAAASKVRLVFDEASLLKAAAPALRKVAVGLGQPILDSLLYGGEDYALLTTGPAPRRPLEAKVIGRVESGQGAVVEGASGVRVLKGGFEHRL